MNLISCENCGVVLDVAKLDFPKEIYDEDYAVIPSLGEWNGSHFVPKVDCPVCKSSVLKE